MPDTAAPYVRMSRVTTRRNSLRSLNCPIEAELIVAEFAGELPPDVALAVREHVAVCETCGPRAQALRAPYELIGSLGSAPAPYVPDLRETVRLRVRSMRFIAGPTRFFLGLGRGGMVALACVVALALVVFFVANSFFAIGAQTAARSSNGVAHAPAAGASGLTFAETDKFVTVTDSAGHPWQVAEVIAVDEHSGAVVRSLPASSQVLRIGSASNAPIAIAVGAQTVFELTPVESGSYGQPHTQALVGFSATTGQVVFVRALTLPDGSALPAGVTADALALAPDGSVAYVGLSVADVTQAAPRVLALDTASGNELRSLSPTLTTTIPMPPPPGSLPSSAFPSTIPHIHVATWAAQQGLGGALVISPDGNWLFDTIALTDPSGNHYIVARRFNAETGATKRELAIEGTFGASQLAADQNVALPSVYLVTGSPVATVYVLDGSALGPTLTGDIPLGGPALPPGVTIPFNDTLSISPTPDGSHLYVAQDASARNGQITGHNVWLVDTTAMTLIATRDETGTAGAVFANDLGAKGPTSMMILRNGQVSLLAPDLSTAPTTWLSLSDGSPVVALLATQV
ncbi:MAG TPA: hypothetical protein VMV29_20395 [Ktedonobacterales bacterium]|nr:hypothetical protein [Ktedonobacterales bacterium]